MKKILLLILVTTLFLSSKAQIKVVKGSDGKYHTQGRKSTPSQATGTLYVDQDSIIHTIFKTDSGKYYIVRKSKKTGKEYKQYLKLENN
jgi:hypothetical protein